MKLKFAPTGGEEGSELEPLIFDKSAATPSYAMIAFQAFLGLGGLIIGAHLFVLAAESMAGLFAMSPLILALLIAPLATELPEMSNSFLWLYRKKDRLAVANVTGAMVFQGTFPVALGIDRNRMVDCPIGIDYHDLSRAGGGTLPPADSDRRSMAAVAPRRRSYLLYRLYGASLCQLT